MQYTLVLEAKVAGTAQIVSKESATLDYAGREQLPCPIDANHSNDARFGSASQHPFVAIASELADIGYTAFEDLSRRLPSLGIENNRLLGAGHSTGIQNIPGPAITVEARQLDKPDFFKRTRYITVFIVDDSTSIEDVPEAGISLWSDTTKYLAEYVASNIWGSWQTEGSLLQLPSYVKGKNIKGCRAIRAMPVRPERRHAHRTASKRAPR